jgi:hypothetical protein
MLFKVSGDQWSAELSKSEGQAQSEPALWNIVFITQYANITYENAQQNHEWSRWSCLV